MIGGTAKQKEHSLVRFGPALGASTGGKTNLSHSPNTKSGILGLLKQMTYNCGHPKKMNVLSLQAYETGHEALSGARAPWRACRPAPGRAPREGRDP